MRYRDDHRHRQSAQDHKERDRRLYPVKKPLPGNREYRSAEPEPEHRNGYHHVRKVVPLGDGEYLHQNQLERDDSD